MLLSGRDAGVYVVYGAGALGARPGMGFITPGSGVRVSPAILLIQRFTPCGRPATGLASPHFLRNPRPFVPPRIRKPARRRAPGLRRKSVCSSPLSCPVSGRGCRGRAHGCRAALFDVEDRRRPRPQVPENVAAGQGVVIQGPRKLSDLAAHRHAAGLAALTPLDEQPTGRDGVPLARDLPLYGRVPSLGWSVSGF